MNVSKKQKINYKTYVGLNFTDYFFLTVRRSPIPGHETTQRQCAHLFFVTLFLAADTYRHKVENQ